MAYDILPAKPRVARSIMRLFTIMIALALPLSMGTQLTSAASDPCKSVFEGVTPADISASGTSAAPGATVVHTITWTTTGVSTVDLTDCFQVDDGTDAALNALVASLSFGYVGTNDGTESFSIVLPADSVLIGHTIWARAKCTKGCKESRSNVIAFEIVPPLTPDPDPTPSDDPTDIPTDDPTDIPTDDPTDLPTDLPTGDPVDDTDTDGPIAGPSDTSDDEGGSVVLSGRTRPKRDALATTGVETTAAWLGTLFLAIGVILRTVRIRPVTSVASAFGIAPTMFSSDGSGSEGRYGSIARFTGTRTRARSPGRRR